MYRPHTARYHLNTLYSSRSVATSCPGSCSGCALKVPLLRGRDITWQDGADKPAVAVISEGVANKLWPGKDPIGKRMRSASGYTPWVTVIGVARDSRQARFN